MWRRLKRILLVVALGSVLAACRVDVGVDVAMEADGSGTVTVTAVADADVLARSPSLATDLRFTDLQTAGWVVEGPTPTTAGGIQVVITHTFQNPADANALVAQIGGPSGPFGAITFGRKVVNKTTTYTLNGQLLVTGGLEAFSDPALTAAVGATPYANEIAGAGLAPGDAVGITFSASLPGKLDNTTAAEGNDGLMWMVPFDGPAVDVSTLSESRDTRNAWASPVATGARIALFVWIGIAVCFIIYVMLRRRRQRIENQPWY
ncbi:MAG: hypothetical protein ABIR32_17680 [Ilumatobacteraceae bacterium]